MDRSRPPTWPLFALRVTCGEVTLRPVREADLAHLAKILPDDYEHDPRAELFDWLTPRENRRRLVHQAYWRTLGTWSPSSWYLSFAVEVDGQVVGVQTLEAENFPVLRTVETGSWLVASARRRGVGVMMRMGVLALAFDQLDAHAGLTSVVVDIDLASEFGASDLGWQATLRVLIAISPPETGWDRVGHTFSTINEIGSLALQLDRLRAITDRGELAQSRPNDTAHYTHRRNLALSSVVGLGVRSLCGLFFVPYKDHDSLPKCAVCEERYRAPPA